MLDDGVAQCRAAIEQVDDVFDFPAALPDQDQDRGPVPEIAAQLAPQVEQQQVIFARLDRADIDEIRPADRRDAGLRGGRQIGAERRRQDRRRPAGAIEMRLQRRAGYRRVHDQRVGERGRGLDPAEVVRRLARLRVFGELDRDQIMDQADEARPAALLQARDQPSLFEMVVRDQQIDGAAGAVAQYAEQAAARFRRAARGGHGARSGAPAARCWRVVERSAPDRADFADKVFGDPARQRAPACRPE